MIRVIPPFLSTLGLLAGLVFEVPAATFPPPHYFALNVTFDGYQGLSMDCYGESVPIANPQNNLHQIWLTSTANSQDGQITLWFDGPIYWYETTNGVKIKQTQEGDLYRIDIFAPGRKARKISKIQFLVDGRFVSPAQVKELKLASKVLQDQSVLDEIDHLLSYSEPKYGLDNNIMAYERGVVRIFMADNPPGKPNKPRQKGNPKKKKKGKDKKGQAASSGAGGATAGATGAGAGLPKPKPTDRAKNLGFTDEVQMKQLPGILGAGTVNFHPGEKGSGEVGRSSLMTMPRPPGLSDEDALAMLLQAGAQLGEEFIQAIEEQREEYEGTPPASCRLNKDDPKRKDPDDRDGPPILIKLPLPSSMKK